MDRHGAMPIAADMGDCLFTAMQIEHTHLTAPGYYASMGYGVPAGFGLQAATGERPLVLVGDGAFQMTGFELGNCRRYGWDPIVIVFNNRSWEMLRAFQPESRFNDLGDWRFAELARVLGGEGERATPAGSSRPLSSGQRPRGGASISSRRCSSRAAYRRRWRATWPPPSAAAGESPAAEERRTRRLSRGDCTCRSIPAPQPRADASRGCARRSVLARALLLLGRV